MGNDGNKNVYCAVAVHYCTSMKQNNKSMKSVIALIANVNLFTMIKPLIQIRIVLIYKRFWVINS